jgi:hypothetical protein
MTVSKTRDEVGALELLESVLQEVFRYGDRYLPIDLRLAANQLWHQTIDRQIQIGERDSGGRPTP